VTRRVRSPHSTGCCLQRSRWSPSHSGAIGHSSPVSLVETSYSRRSQDRARAALRCVVREPQLDERRAASVTLVQAQPVFVALGAWLLLRERVTSRMTVGIAVAVAGMMAMSLGDLLGGVLVGPRPIYGNGLALFGAIMAAGYVLAGRSIRQRVALIPYVVVVYGVCTLSHLAIVLAEGHGLTGYPRANGRSLSASLSDRGCWATPCSTGRSRTSNRASYRCRCSANRSGQRFSRSCSSRRLPRRSRSSVVAPSSSVELVLPQPKAERDIFD